VAHSGVCVEIFTDEAVFEVSDFTFLLIYAEVGVEQGDSGAVVTAVFEAFETFQDNWISFSGSDISNNATHRNSNFSIQRAILAFYFQKGGGR
jgi:hypothetical protein